MFDPMPIDDDALSECERRLDAAVADDVLVFESKLAATFPRLTVHEYVAIVGSYSLAHSARVKRQFIRRFDRTLNP
jgi:hypothetical protein